MKNRTDKRFKKTLTVKIVELSFFIFILSLTQLQGQPSKPGNVYAVSRDRQNEVHWAKSNSADMLEYRVYRAPDTVNFSFIGGIPSSDSVYYDNKLTNGIFYFYCISAVNKAGQESKYSNMDASSPDEGLDRYLEFDGSQGRLMVDDNKSLNISATNSFSVECWVQLKDTTNTRCILSRQDKSDASVYYELKYSKGRFIFGLNGGAYSVQSEPSANPVIPNKWYHVAFTYQYTDDAASRTMKLYINGDLTNTGISPSGSGEGNKKAMLLFGAGVNPNGVYQNLLYGDIKETRLWNIALQQATIKQNMEIPLRGDEHGLLGLWHCNGIYNSRIYDYSPANNNAVVYGNIAVLPLQVTTTDDFITVVENSRNNVLNVRQNDTIISANHLPTILLSGYPLHGYAVTYNKDSISYSPVSGYNGIDVIKYCVRDTAATSISSLASRYADTSYVFVNVQCGKRSVFTWAPYAAESTPNHKTLVKDGVGLTFRLNDPLKITNTFSIIESNTGKYLHWSQSPAKNSSVSTTSVAFDAPAAQVCFQLKNIGSQAGQYKDSLTIAPYMDGKLIAINAGQFSLPSSISYKGYNVFTGSNSLTSSTNEGNAEICLFTRVDSILFTYGNSATNTANIATQSIGIGNFSWCELPNHAPQFVNANGEPVETYHRVGFEDSAFHIRLPLKDADRDVLTITEATSLHGKGTVQGIPSADSSFVYVPQKDYFGPDTLRVVMQDGRNPAMSDTVRISLEIQPVNDAPSILNQDNNPITFLADSVLAGVTKTICLKLRDVDGDKATIVKDSLITGKGEINITNDSCFSYLSSPGFRGTDEFIVIVADNQSPPARTLLHVYMNVLRLNNAPEILDFNGDPAYYLLDTLKENTTKQVCIRAMDKDRDNTAIYSIKSLGGHFQSVLLPGSNLCFYVTPDQDFYGNDSLQLVITDDGSPVKYDTAILKMHVKHMNRPPEIINPIGTPVAIIDKTVDMNKPEEICLFVRDVDNDSTIVSYGKSLNNNGLVEIVSKENKCLKYSPNKDFIGEDTAIVIISDNGIPVLKDTVKVVFHVIPAKINNPPVIADNTNKPVDTLAYAMNEGELLEVCINVIDPDNDKFNITEVSQLHGQNNALVGAVGGNCFNYMPKKGYIGTNELFVKICDNGFPSLCDSVIVVITVKPKLTIAQGLSPDGDGINDNWVIEGIEKYPNNSVTIFSQAGEIVYKINGYDNINNVWKGETKGQLADSSGKVINGTYFYIIDIPGVSSRISGFIVIKR